MIFYDHNHMKDFAVIELLNETDSVIENAICLGDSETDGVKYFVHYPGFTWQELCESKKGATICLLSLSCPDKTSQIYDSVFYVDGKVVVPYVNPFQNNPNYVSSYCLFEDIQKMVIAKLQPNTRTIITIIFK